MAWQRTDPTRTLLGEEQYAWLEKTIRTDPAPLIVVTGLNALHTVWGEEADQTSRVFADYARVQPCGLRPAARPAQLA